MPKADNLPPSCAVVTKSGNLNFLELCKARSGPVTAFYSNIRLKEREKSNINTSNVDNNAPRRYINQNILYKKELYQKHKGGS